MSDNQYRKLADGLISENPGLCEEAKNAWIIADRLTDLIGQDSRNKLEGPRVLKQDIEFRSHLFALVAAYKMHRSNKELAEKIDVSNKRIADKLLKYTKVICWLTVIVVIATIINIVIAFIN